MTKQELRKEIKNRLKDSEIFNKHTESQRICEKIINSSVFADCEILFTYMALPDEVDLLPVLERALALNKKVAVPVCLEAPRMRFVLIKSIDDLKSGSFGILEPENSENICDALEFFEGGALQRGQPPMEDCSKRGQTPFEIPAQNRGQTPVLILVPGRAFTLQGDRLGRGKGFYDWYLNSQVIEKGKKNRVHCSGVCFPQQIVESIPCNEHDIKMDSLFY